MKVTSLIVMALAMLSASVYGSASGLISKQGVEPPGEASKYAHKLVSEMNWCTSLQAAQAKAKAENKLVFWMHMLGKLDGMT